MTYIDLSDINLTDTIRPSNLVYNNPASNDDYEGVYLQKFTINTQSFPVFCPVIKPKNEINRLTFPNGSNVTSSQWSSDDYMSDWCIAIYDTTSNKYSSQPVKWVPQKDENLKPGFFPSRYEVLKNKYFWAYNSIHVLSLIQSTIDQILTDLGAVVGDVLIIKTDKAFQILTLKDNLKIFFNYPLRQAFDFYYTTNFQYTNGAEIKDFNEIVINKNITTEYGGGDYFTAQVLALSSRLFPFSDIQFSSSRLPIHQIYVSNNLQSNQQVKNPIIFSYSLNVTDIDSIVDRFYYTASSDFRKSLLMQNVTQFDIQIYFKTFDNYMIELLLDKNDSVNMLLQFVA